MRVLTFVLSASLVLSTAAAAQSGGGTASQQANTRAQSGKDTEFAQKAAMGGQMEVEMAQMASEKASNGDVKEYANRLVKDHTAANQELMSIMKAKQISETTQSAGTKAAQKNQAWTTQSGAAFDRGFLDHAIDHHKKDIALFEAESKSGTDAELKAFASKTLPTLREHLKMAQDLKSKKPGTTKQ